MTAGRRDRLASALGQADVDLETGWPSDEGLLNALMPTIDRMIRQAQAEALNEFADDIDEAMASDGDQPSLRLRLTRPTVHVVATAARDRAAALSVTTDHPDVTQDAP